MRSVIHESFGDPADVLRTADMPVPDPAPGQVRVRTILSPIHNHDLWTVRGSYGYKPALPAIGGSEAVGVIDAVGEGLDPALIGRRVAAAGVHGSWAEYFLAPAQGVLPLPDTIPDEAAAQLVAMPFSAITLLEFLGVGAGDWIIQNAANGAVGRMLAVLAGSRGVNTINLVRRDEAVAELEEAGLSHAVSTAQPDWKDRVRAITGDAPIRAGVDSIGGAASEDLAGLLGDNGLLVSFGTMSGGVMHVSSGTMIFKQLTLKGFWGARVAADMAPAHRAELMGEIIRRVASRELPLPVQGIFGFEDVAAAVRASLAPGKVGKVLLRP